MKYLYEKGLWPTSTGESLLMTTMNIIWRFTRKKADEIHPGCTHALCRVKNLTIYQQAGG